MPPSDLDLERIYRDHGHIVVRRAHRILGDESEAREVLQEIFLSLVARPGQFKGQSSITTFLYAVTTNACLTRLRDQRRRSALLAQDAVGRADAIGPVGEASVAVQQLLARLPERLARIAVYFFLDEMTHEEIAALLGLSRRQIGNLVARVEQEARKCARAA